MKHQPYTIGDIMKKDRTYETNTKTPPLVLSIKTTFHNENIYRWAKNMKNKSKFVVGLYEKEYNRVHGKRSKDS